MYRIFFIHFSVEEHLGCFQVLDIMNNAVMNISEQELPVLQLGRERFPDLLGSQTISTALNGGVLDLCSWEEKVS